MAISNAEIKIAPEVSQFIAQPRKLLIDGQWVTAASGKTFPVYNPATGEVMAQGAARVMRNGKITPGANNSARRRSV
jgi:phenylacetaldehyde dehydrogenase